MFKQVHHNALRLIVMVVLCQSVIVGPALAAGPASTNGDRLRDPTDTGAVSQLETADEYLAAFQQLNGTPALTNYTELEIIRSQAVTDAQAGTFDQQKRNRLREVLRLLRSFDTAFRALENESYQMSLQEANESASAVQSLRGMNSQSYAALAELALDRFHTDFGVRLSDRAQTIDNTRQRLQMLEYAATAYRRGGAIDRYSDLKIRIDDQRSEFREDLDQYNQSAAAAEQFLQRCNSNCDSPVNAVVSEPRKVFGEYAAALAARSDATTATSVASEHALSDQVSTSQTLVDRTTNVVINFAIASAAIVMGYALIIGLLVALLVHRIAAWEDDVRQARVDEIVLMGGVQ